MKVFVVYKDKSESGSEVREYLREFERRTGVKLEEVDPETVDGASICRVYDIVEYPTMVAVDGEGTQHNMWRGTPLPLMDEVNYYVQQ